MRDLDKFKEVCELLKIWYFLQSSKIVWPDAVRALETRINLLTRDE